MEVLVCSTLLAVEPRTEVHFHIFDGGISTAQWITLKGHVRRLHTRATIAPLPFSDAPFVGFPTLNGTRMAYARLLLGECLPDLDKIVYLDSDILVLADPTKLRDLPMHGKIALAVPDALLHRLSDDCPWLPFEVASKFPYFNSGVLVLDLKRWRETGAMARAMAAIAEKPSECRFWDQTALNYILRDEVGYISTDWNTVAFSYEDLSEGPVNLHLISEKPWRNLVPRFDHYVWRAFYSDLIDPQHRFVPNSPLANRIIYSLPQSVATQWLFKLVMRALVAISRDPNQRRRRTEMLRNGSYRKPAFDRLRASWLARRRALQNASRIIL